jgi:hypothetical protein
MKRLFLVVFAASLLFLMSDCSDDFLIKLPQGEYSENIFCTEKGIDALLT